MAPKLTVADAEIAFDRPAVAIDRLIRACTPAPGAWTTFRADRVKLGPVTLQGAEVSIAPGQVSLTTNGVLVGTATTPVQLGTVQPPGKRPMPASDWARGARLTSEDRLGR
jgi:methionyl-tRNA formyltransferase